MRIAYLGNFDPPYSTENEYAHAFEQHGHTVTRFQEGDIDEIRRLVNDIRTGDPFHFVLWTRTKGLADAVGDTAQWELIATCRGAGGPLVGVHLDRWWGLDRQTQITTDPYFRGCDVLFTADGAHQNEWADAGVNHRWLPPGISERWCQPGTRRDEYDCDVVFVGGWQNYGHREWTHRAELIRHLSERFGDRFLAIPRPHRPAIRGLELNDVYWSAKVAVGDSCLVPKVDGTPMTHYCSDRIPETLGRGGVLIHPRVEGINRNGFDPFYAPGTFMWDLYDWDELDHFLDLAVGPYTPDRPHIIEHARAKHTYTVRAQQIIDTLIDEDML